jgi:hypothetical protein
MIRARGLRWLALACVALCVWTSIRPVAALEIEFAGRAIKRELLALYDSRDEREPHLTRLHKLVEMPANHLGFKLVFHDVNTPLPPAEELRKYRAIVTWFIAPLVQPERYLAWLEQALTQGPRYVVLGEVAPPESDAMMPALNRVLARLGLKSEGIFVDLTYRAKVTASDPAMIGFERKLDKVIPGFPVLTRRNPEARSYLELTAPLIGKQLTTVLVATNEGGGYAAQNFVIFHEPNTDRMGWLINPFLFLRRALGEERFPIPDVTTVSGRRIYFSHIDGDGWNNLTEVESYRDGVTSSAEVIAREAIEPYPDLPVSVGVISGDVLSPLGGTADGAKVARRLFALPQVEVASHTHTHPFNWGFFESYRRDEEMKLIEAARAPDLPLRQRFGALISNAAGRPRPVRDDKYIAGSDSMPRSYLREPFDVTLETSGALRLAEQFAPAGKKAKLYLWSGNTTPFEAAIRAVRLAGARNMNGGDTRLDREFPSVAYVPAIGRAVGAERQIYAVNSNENTYTNEWTGPFGGQMLLGQTLDNTDKPRRLKGFNLYYHMYSGEKPSALATIRHYLELARRSSVAPVAASHYSAIADSYFGVELAQVGLFAWAVESRGDLNTVRFDEAEELELDHAQSSGVVGATRHNDALYVTLDPEVKRAVVALKPRNSERSPGVATPSRLVFEHARWQLSGVRESPCLLRFQAEGYGPGEMTFKTVRGQAFKVRAARGDATLVEEIVFPDAEDRLNVRLDINGLDPVEVSVACHG